MKGLKWKLLMKTLSLVLTGVLTNTEIHSNEVSVQNFVFVKSSLFCVNCASAFWKRAISPKIGCNSQMNFLHAPLLHKKNCPDWTQLNDPIHIPDIVFHFLEHRSPKFPCSQVQQVLLIGPFLFFFLLFLPWPLVRLPTGTKWHWRRALLRITGILLKWHCFTFLHSQHDRCCFFCFSNFWLKREKIILI